MGGHVFLLGSGFSAAVAPADMPTVVDLVTPLRHELGSSLARYVSGAVFPEPDDVEVMLTALAMPQPFLKEEEHLRNRALYLQIARWLAEFIYAGQRHALGSPIPPWFERLVLSWHERRATVVTLNYDTLVECAVASAPLLPVPAGGIPVEPSDLYPMPVALAKGRFTTLWSRGEPRPETFTLCKLHGSLGWWAAAQPAPAGQPIYDVELWPRFNSHTRPGWHDVRAQAIGLPDPVIVPPVTAKFGYLDNDLLRENWSRAREALEVADCIFVLGYSIPVADTQIRALLGTLGGADVVLVDRAGDRLEHVQRVLPNAYVFDTHCGSGDAIESFVADYTSPSYEPPSGSSS